MKAADAARIFLVDDHPLVRESLANLIEHQPDLTVCGEADHPATARSGIAATKPDVAIVDLSLGDGSGLSLIRDLHATNPEIAVLVLSMYDEDVYAERVLRAGARGYIMKREVSQNVILAIRRVREGKVYLSPRMTTTLAEKLVRGAPAADQSPVTLLSDRELEVFRLVGQGRATRQIADSLHLSPKTVQAFSARIKEKLGLASSTELLREAIRWVEDQRER
ncbi:MAG TPA: response regulator transcription factor [Candidatus Acidoferrales bacterium]|nr:response regulator transcription factor [Candidatus Acidoferrales bacterium]